MPKIRSRLKIFVKIEGEGRKSNYKNMMNKFLNNCIRITAMSFLLILYLEAMFFFLT